MSRENVEIVARMLDRAQHDPPALWDVLDEEVVFEVGPIAILDVAPIYHGPAGDQEFFRRWIGPFEEWGYETLELIDAGDSVVAQIHQWGRGRVSAATVAQTFWQSWTLRDGRLVRGSNHASKEDALLAAGAST